MLGNGGVAAMHGFRPGQPDFTMYGKYPSAKEYQQPDSSILCMRTKEAPLQSIQRTKKTKPPVEQYPFYVALIVDPYTGKVSTRSSANLKLHKHSILDEAGTKFCDTLRNIGPGLEALGFATDPLLGWVAAPRENEQRPKPKNQSNRPYKKRKGDDNLSFSDTGSQKDPVVRQDDDPPEGGDSKTISHRADAKHEWEKWFTDAFRAVQQVSCRVIAKEWIKTIHPKKQSTHPYNGKNPRTGERGDSSSTKPPYWPREVIHKEPDHINKEARTKLLVHLLMSTPHQEMSISGDARSNKEITAEVLKESLEQKKTERQMGELRKKYAIVEQIIDVRTSLESYEMGGLRADAMIQAADYTDFGRGNKIEDESDEAEEIRTDTEDSETRADDSRRLGNESFHASSSPSTEAHAATTTHRGSRKKSKSANVSRRTSKHDRVELGQVLGDQEMVTSPQPAFNQHSSLTTTGWDPSQSVPPVDRYACQGSHASYAEPAQNWRESYGPVPWTNQVHHSLDTTAQFHDPMMLSPSVDLASIPPVAYMSTPYPPGPQPGYPGMVRHPPYAPDAQESHRRQLPQDPSFGHYIDHTSQSSSHDEMLRAYFG